MEEKAIQLVKNYLQNPNSPDDIEVFIVWSCYILGNRKYIIGVKNSPDYFEVTYNSYTHEWYRDRYILQDKQVIKE